MLNVVDEQTTETDQIELTVSDDDFANGCEVIVEEDEVSSSLFLLSKNENNNSGIIRVSKKASTLVI